MCKMDNGEWQKYNAIGLCDLTMGEMNRKDKYQAGVV